MKQSQLLPYSVDDIFKAINRVRSERAIRSGFSDSSIYNSEMLRLDNIDENLFNNLRAKIGTTKALETPPEIVTSDTGMTEAEIERERQKQEPKKREKLTPEEKRALEMKKLELKARQNAIAILRGISIRMPLLIYGANVEFDHTIDIEEFVNLVDDESWKEFMPPGVTKSDFKKFIKYYDKEVFRSAAKEIRMKAKAADRYAPTERVSKIAEIFSYFRNPDKETVLTPWRVVNMHMSDTIGGYDFFDNQHKEVINESREVNIRGVTDKLFKKDDIKILELNSKSGLYPLYVAYTVFRKRAERLKDLDIVLTRDTQIKLWKKVVEENIYVLCKTPMAKSITRRTLLGYMNVEKEPNLIYYKDLIKDLSNNIANVANQVNKTSFWNIKEPYGEKEMNFDAIVGNPPYQLMDGGGNKGSSARPIYHLFVELAKKLNPIFLSMVMPSRWYAGGKGLDAFRENMLDDKRIRFLHDYIDSKDVFPTVDIAGGICFILWDRNYSGLCKYFSHIRDKVGESTRSLNDFNIFIRDNVGIEVIKKITCKTKDFYNLRVFSRNPFGISTSERGSIKSFNGAIKLISSGGIGYIKLKDVKQNADIISRYKVSIGKVVPNNGEVGVNPEKGYKAITRSRIILPNEVFTDSYLLLDKFLNEVEANNCAKYFTTKFSRYLARLTFSSMNISKENFRFVPLQDFTKSSDINWEDSISNIDKALYKKYGLSKDEVEFIEKMIAPME